MRCDAVYCVVLCARNDGMRECEQSRAAQDRDSGNLRVRQKIALLRVMLMALMAVAMVMVLLMMMVMMVQRWIAPKKSQNPLENNTPRANVGAFIPTSRRARLRLTRTLSSTLAREYLSRSCFSVCPWTCHSPHTHRTLNTHRSAQHG